jgi:hypothetical protein
VDRLTRLIQPTDLRQGRREPEMREWQISVGLDGAARPERPASPRDSLTARRGATLVGSPVSFGARRFRRRAVLYLKRDSLED